MEELRRGALDAGVDETCAAEDGLHGRLQEAEAALRGARQEIGALRQAVALREAFIAAIGHELRNPMVPILLSVERLRGLADSGDLQRLARNIDVLGHATDAFMRRAMQLLDLSRLGNSGFLLVTERRDISCIVSETAQRHEEVARRAGCSMHVDVQAGLVAHVDRTALEQLLDNLLSNAFKYGAGRPIEISLHQVGSKAELAVIDNGMGIPLEEQSRIFGLFDRARDPGAPGLGIGLWIAARLADAMAGHLSVRSGPGCGAAFTLAFPLGVDDAQDPDAGERATSGAMMPEP